MKYTSKYTPEQWAEIIAQGETSGLRRKDFLEINGITKDQYYYWKTRLPKLMNNTAIVAPDNNNALVEVPVERRIPGNIQATETVIAAVVHIGNISIELNNNASMQFMENLGRMIQNAL